MENFIQVGKELSPRQFSIKLRFRGREWIFDVRAHHSQDPRFEGVIKSADDIPIEFVLIRSSIGKWLISGETLPEEMVEFAQEIGKAFEEVISELNNQDDSGSFPGDKDMVHEE